MNLSFEDAGLDIDSLWTKASSGEDEVENFAKVCLVLSGTGILLNSFILLIVYKPRLKTKLKLIVSLAFADFLLATFHLVFAFVEVESPWSRKSRFKVSISGSSIPGMDLTILPLPRGILGSLLSPLPVAVDQNAVSGTAKVNQENHTGIMIRDLDANPIQGDSLRFLQGFVDSFIRVSALRLGLNISNAEANVSVDVSREELYQQMLSAFYLLPNIAAVLSMFFINSCLMMTVWMPLKSHLIFSKKRGTAIACLIWSVSFLLSLSQFINKHMNQNNMFAENAHVSMAQIFIWYATLAIFLIITCTFIIIIYLLSKKSSLPLSTFTQNRRKSNIRATVTALAVTGTYAICFLPFIWLELLQMSIDLTRSQFIWWFGLMQALFILNTNLDPIIYSFMLPEVANGVKNLWRRTKQIVTCNWA